MPLPPWMGRWGGPLRLLSQGSCLFFFFEELRSSCFSAGTAERCGGFSPPPGRSRSSAGGTGGGCRAGTGLPPEREPHQRRGHPGWRQPSLHSTPPFSMPLSLAKPPTTLPSSHPNNRGGLTLKTGGLQHRGEKPWGETETDPPKSLLSPVWVGSGCPWRLTSFSSSFLSSQSSRLQADTVL